jgi:hypothetical protein
MDSVLENDRRNVFQLYSELKKLPFSVSRRNWPDYDIAIVAELVPKGDYGRVRREFKKLN